MHSTPRLPDVLRDAISLTDLARRLGAPCLDNGGSLGQVEPVVAKELDRLQKFVESVDPEQWMTPAEDDGYLPIVGAVEGFEDAVRDLDAHGAPTHRAFLLGLCRFALPLFYRRTTDTILLDRGSPVPWVSRPIVGVFDAATPSADTMTLGHPLHPQPYSLFPSAAGDRVRVALDYGHRDRLDELTWDREQGVLPQVATLHPPLGPADLVIETSPDASTFFDAAPRHFALGDLLQKLRNVRAEGVDIAVLPELSLPPESGLLEALGAAEPGTYPALVVAGSAHIRSAAGTRAVRANECTVVLDGKAVVRHRKIHPFRLKDLSGARIEDLSSEPKTLRLLSGAHTRLGVVICADLNDSVIKPLLQAAWVNLLLAPALTEKIGSFAGAVSALASDQQAVAVIVNGDQPSVPVLGGGEVRPFHVLVAVPRPRPAEQTREAVAPSGTPTPIRGRFDPNLPLDAAITWDGG